MRVGAMVVGILFSIWTFFEAFILGSLSNAANDEDMSTATGIGFMAAVVAGIASALVLALPLVSAILFLFAGFLSFGAALAGYGNHWVYGPVFLGLALMSFFGWLGKRKEGREKRAEQLRQTKRDARLEGLLQRQPAGSIPETACPSCGSANSVGTRFCGRCGRSLAVVSG